MDQHLAPAPAYVPAYVLALWKLPDDSAQLHVAWSLFTPVASRPDRPWHVTAARDFLDVAAQILGDDAVEDVVVCHGCDAPTWTDDTYTDVEGNAHCEPCRDNGTFCDDCGEWSTSDWWRLNTCCDTSLCESCWDDRSYYCERCEQSYLGCCEDEHDHDAYCGCEPQDLHFEILANSHGTAHQDERLHVELPAGHLSDAAVDAVLTMLWEEQFYPAYADLVARNYAEPKAPYLSELRELLDGMDRAWQTKAGNFTRRLSKAIWQTWGIKLDTGLLSRVGSVARDHAGSTSEWWVEFTRDLNQPAENFYHEDSCWWQSYNDSLCALKHWGGVAIRSYTGDTMHRDCPSGRAWLQPLGADMRPTQDVRNAHAYVVYNGYGDLAGYGAARLVAYLTSKTYRKIGFEANYQYINAGGYLIADQDVCDATNSVYIGGDLNPHSKVAA